MLNFLKSLFANKKKFPISSEKTAIMFVIIEGNKDPQELQFLAMSKGAPIFFRKMNNGRIVGRCGLPRFEFPPKEIGFKLVLNSIRDFLESIDRIGINFNIDTDKLSEEDHNKLIAFLTE